ncbi:MAG: glycogen synthase [Acidobacteriota bacterium]|jgi:glycosyltransferase involved in cell wall biosynthesis|nr:glycogen synthase [Acidobacteriota bacterium]
MLRPLWLTENYPPDRGGMAQSCDRIVHALRTRGMTVDVAHVSRRHTDWRVETKMRGKQISCPASEDPSHTLNRLWNLISHSAADEAPTHVVAFGGTLPLLAGPPYAAWLGLPLVTLIRGNDFDAAIFSPKKSDVLRAAMQASARVCTVTRDHAARIEALDRSVRTEWIPNGVDGRVWRLFPHDKEEARRWRSDNVADGRRVIGLFGQLKQKKGALFFLDALERSGLASQVHLLLVGDLDEELQSALGERFAATVMPFRDRLDLLPLYAACDAIVVPSFYDGLPNVVLEAAALGIPLLTSNAGGMADFLRNGENAIVFAAGDEHDCRRAIADFARLDDDALQSLGTRCQRFVLDELTVEREAERYIEVLNTTAHVARPRRSAQGEGS